ncbi:MAG: SURF1 family protein [Anaerolineae bacterium]
MIATLKRFWIGHIIVIIGVIILVNLGFWQLRRLEQRRALNAEIRAGLEATPVQLTGQPVDPEALHRSRVTVTGVLDNAENIIIENRPFQGRAGVELVTPLKIAGSDQAVLVNRGWIPLDQVDPAARRAYDIEGEVTIEGIAYRTEPQPTGYLVMPDPTLAPGETRLDAWFRVDTARIAEQLGYPLLPLYVKQSPGPNPDEMPLREENFDLSEGSHLGYAMQWFTFAVVLVAVYGSLLWQESRKSDEE